MLPATPWIPIACPLAATPEGEQGKTGRMVQAYGRAKERKTDYQGQGCGGQSTKGSGRCHSSEIPQQYRARSEVVREEPCRHRSHPHEHPTKEGERSYKPVAQGKLLLHGKKDAGEHKLGEGGTERARHWRAAQGSPHFLQRPAYLPRRARSGPVLPPGQIHGLRPLALPRSFRRHRGKTTVGQAVILKWYVLPRGDSLRHRVPPEGSLSGQRRSNSGFAAQPGAVCSSRYRSSRQMSGTGREP
ncbi:MAG: hypothetical protein KatS3mg027_0030 [Bacteroidia bacterium]|nr:MAG: hypothetical protein KatS3mg027_0030 [Bacteroidia bacterium]